VYLIFQIFFGSVEIQQVKTFVIIMILYCLISGRETFEGIECFNGLNLTERAGLAYGGGKVILCLNDPANHVRGKVGHGALDWPGFNVYALVLSLYPLPCSASDFLFRSPFFAVLLDASFSALGALFAMAHNFIFSACCCWRIASSIVPCVMSR
jgi:hypothetical protein